MKKKLQQLNTAKAQARPDTTLTKIKHGRGRAQHLDTTQVQVEDSRSKFGAAIKNVWNLCLPRMKRFCSQSSPFVDGYIHDI